MKNQKGFTLIEIAIVVAVAFSLLIGLNGYKRFRSDTIVNAEVEELKYITTQIKEIHGTQATYAGVTMTSLIAARVFPANRVTGAATAINRWGGAITSAVTTITTTNDGLTLSYAAVPEYECINLAFGVNPFVAEIDIDGVSVKAFGGQINRTTLATQCTGGSNTIVYTITK